MSKKSVVLHLHVHQPWRLRQYGIFDIAQQHDYFLHSPAPEQDNELIFYRVAEKSYTRMNALLEKLLEEHADFKLSLSITGTFIEQAERFAPDLLESFQRLVATGRVEIVAETYYHSLAFFYSRPEFVRQVALHQQKIRELFGVETKVFRNTELAYNNELAKWAEEAGFSGILAEGHQSVLGWRSPNYLYRPSGAEKIGLLMRNSQLSDDIAVRFGDQSWSEWPLTAEKYVNWLHSSLKDAPLINLSMNYETFGEHWPNQTGIFRFFEVFVDQWLKSGGQFSTISQAISENSIQGEISVPETTTQTGGRQGSSLWQGNNLQREAMRYLYDLERDVMASGQAALIDDWRKLQAADHAYYMSTDHAAGSPYDSPYDAFLYFMNALRDLAWRADHQTEQEADDV